MNQTAIMAPDHLGIEFGFMQMLTFRDERAAQLKFMSEHLLPWVIPYMQGMKSMASSPFYSDFCDFVIEFLSSDYETIVEENVHVD